MAFFIQFLSKGREVITDYQRKQIRELRMRGAGYRAIASPVGVSRDVVRNYCKSNGLEGYGTALTININEQIQKDKACLFCGKQIVRQLGCNIFDIYMVAYQLIEGYTKPYYEESEKSNWNCEQDVFFSQIQLWKISDIESESKR